MGFAILAQHVSKIHRIVRGFNKVNWPLPRLFRGETSFFRGNIVIPGNGYLHHLRALHGGIAIQVLLEVGIVAIPGMGYSQYSKSMVIEVVTAMA